VRIALVSDSHVPTRASAIPGRIYEICANCDLLIHAGDLVDLDTLHDLERLVPVKAVLGNMDDISLTGILPRRLDIELEGFRVCVAHGSGAPLGLDERVLAHFRGEPDVLVYGHSHTWDEHKRGPTLVINPGAACNPKGSRSAGILTLVRGTQPSVEKIVF